MTLKEIAMSTVLAPVLLVASLFMLVAGAIGAILDEKEKDDD